MLPQFQLDNQLCFRLYSASRLLTQAYHPLLAPYGLTYPQYLVMLVLWEQDSQKVNDIAKRLLLETNTVTPLLKRMEQEGLVRRSKSAEDARQVLVQLTTKGREMEKELSDIPMRVAGAVSCASLTPKTVPQLFRMLDDMIEKLKD